MRIPAISQRKRARIEIIPLIDSVFFLLATFVMVSLSMVKNNGIAGNLPRASTGAAQDKNSFTTLTVTEKGVLYIDKEKIKFDVLASRLKALHVSDPELKVLINGDESVSFGEAVKVLDEVRRLGITRVSIQTTPAR